MNAAETHRSVIEVLIAHAAGYCASFGELLVHLPGVYPADAAASLDRLVAQRLVDPAAAARLNPSAQPHGASGESDDEDDILPRPHPLDYDWRFSPRTVETLHTRCIQLSQPGDTIVMLGTPTLLRAAARDAQRRRWVLLEASPATTAALSRIAPGDVMRCDLAHDELPRLDARVVVADPPWYPEHARVFLWAAAQLSRAGATLLLAQPAVATRPGVLAERAGLLAFACGSGLQAARIRSGALSYTCPPFERHALEISGLAQAVPVTWRRGDLIELHRTRAPPAARPARAKDEAWREVMLNGARIRFRLDQPGAQAPPADPRVQHLAEGNVLASVSRRDPIRQHVAVWTASNRVFGCRSPRLLAVIAAALANAHSVAPAAQTHLGRHPSRAEQAFIDAAAGQLAELARAEAATSHTRHRLADSIGGLHNPARGDTARPGQINAGRWKDPASARSAS